MLNTIFLCGSNTYANQFQHYYTTQTHTINFFALFWIKIHIPASIHALFRQKNKEKNLQFVNSIQIQSLYRTQATKKEKNLFQSIGELVVVYL